MINKFWFDAKNINCFKNGFRVIKDLNLKISYSENVILIGPNGSGKSSLIEIINRNLYPVVTYESKLKIFDKEHINLWELRKRISTVNNDIKHLNLIGFMSQEIKFGFNYMTIIINYKIIDPYAY